MQDRYTADVGDYGKYGLLRAIAGLYPRTERQLSLGVVWYLTDATMEMADPVGDGKHVAYLNPSQARRFRGCDPELYDTMGSLIESRNRRVAAVRETGVLGQTAVFYEARLHTPVRSQSFEERTSGRERWLAGAEETISRSDIVFVDPDNGVEASSVQRHHKMGSKYTYLDELSRLADDDRSLVVYHHLSRSADGASQIRNVADRIRYQLDPSYSLDAVWYHRGTARAFVIATSARHTELVGRRVNTLLDGPWAAHFTRETV